MSDAFTLWFRPPLAPGRRRLWKRIGTAGTRFDCLALMKGSGDYLILDVKEKHP